MTVCSDLLCLHVMTVCSAYMWWLFSLHVVTALLHMVTACSLYMWQLFILSTCDDCLPSLYIMTMWILYTWWLSVGYALYWTLGKVTVLMFADLTTMAWRPTHVNLSFWDYQCQLCVKYISESIPHLRTIIAHIWGEIHTTSWQHFQIYFMCIHHIIAVPGFRVILNFLHLETIMSIPQYMILLDSPTSCLFVHTWSYCTYNRY